jgi:O-antigen ligase
MVPIGNGLDFARHAKFFTFAIILGLIFLETFRNQNERKNAVKIMGIGAVVFGLFSVVYNLAGLNVTYDYRLEGPLDSAVYLSYYLTPFFIYFVIDYFENRKGWLSLIYAVILALLMIGTRSMGSIAGSFIVLVVYLVRRSDLKIFKNKMLRIILVFLFLIISGLVFYVKILPSLQTHNTSLGERNEIWDTSVELLKDPLTLLFGAGFGQFEYRYIQNVDRVIGQKPLDYNIIHPHNLFLLFIFQFGILGLVLIIYCIYRTIQKLVKEGNSSNINIVACYILLYFFLHGMIDTPFFKNDLLILLLIFLEMGPGLSKKSEQA